jgi:hypothetical protein
VRIIAACVLALLVSSARAVNTTIKLGNGDGDSVIAGRTLNDVITLGGGAGDTVHPSFGGGGTTDKITLGDGAGDVVSGGVSDGIITLGNGAGDVGAASLTVVQSPLAMATMIRSTSSRILKAPAVVTGQRSATATAMW